MTRISSNRCVRIGLLAIGSAMLQACSPTDALVTPLRSNSFGQEQSSLFGIRSSMRMTANADNAAEYGEITIRDTQFNVRRSAGMLTVDANRNNTFEDDDTLATGHAPLEYPVRVGNEIVTVVFFSSNSKKSVEYAAGEVWTTQLRHGDESVAIGSLWFGTGLTFLDTDDDGIFETYWDLKAPRALGGRFWTLTLDFPERRATLGETDQPPISAGFAAPSVRAVDLGSGLPIDLPSPGTVTLLLFCHAKCAGCIAMVDALASLSSAFAQHDDVRLVCVHNAIEEAEACVATICPSFEHAVAAQAWDVFAVTPTPTFIVVGRDGTILFRGSGGHDHIAAQLAGVMRRGL